MGKLFTDGFNKVVAFFAIFLGSAEYFVWCFDLRDNKLNYVTSFIKNFWITIKVCILVKKVALTNRRGIRGKAGQ